MTLTSATSPALLRRINLVRVLQELRRSGPLSRADVARATGLSRPTVSAVVADLEYAGYVRASGSSGDGLMGRPGQRYEFRADRAYVVGVDIGAHKIVMLLADLNGQVVARRHADTRTTGGTASGALMLRVAAEADALLLQGGVARADLLTVVAGTPGVVSDAGVLQLAPQLAGWEGLDLRAAISQIFGCPALVDRETSLSLIAEQWLGHAKGLSDALYLHISVGISAALLVDGKIRRGANGAAGEIGLMPLEGVTTGGFGPFESAVGGVGLARAGEQLARSENGQLLLNLAGGNPTAVDAAVVFRAAAAGDNAAAAIVSRAIDGLAIGVSALVCALNPSAVIVSGGVSLAGDQLLGPLEQRVAAMTPYPPTFHLSLLGDEAPALGALRLATDDIEERLVATMVPAERDPHMSVRHPTHIPAETGP